MASSRSLLSEDQFQCSICLDVFADPVSTPCGHNFCMACLSKYWDNSQSCQCPLCKKEFSKRPELSVNTFISGLVLHFKESYQAKPSSCLKEPPTNLEYVPCDVCTDHIEAAVKSCLNCGMSFCETHLEHHKTAAKLQKHKLITAVKNVEVYICQKHERAVELFCKDDQTCVCVFCTETDHKSHNTLPIDEESRERKGQITRTQAQIKEMIQKKMKNIEDIKHDVELKKQGTVSTQIAFVSITEREESHTRVQKNTAEGKVKSTEVFTALMRSIERSQAEVLEVLEERQKVAEMQGECLIKVLEQEITKLKARGAELEQLSHTEDNLHLVQNYPGTTLSTLPHTNNWTKIDINTDWSKDCLNAALLMFQKLVTEAMERMPKNSSDDVLEQQQQMRTHTVVPDLKTQSAEIAKLLKTPLLEGDMWCLVDTYWFKQWKKYVGFDSRDQMGEQKPGPVDNTGLLKDEDSLSIKDHLIDELDYILLPTEGWLKLICWYGLAEGQKPIARKVIKQGWFVKHFKVEVYLTELRLCERSDMGKQITGSFSKTDTVASVEKEMRGLFGVPDEKETRLWRKYMSKTFERLNKPDETIENTGLFTGQIVIIEQKNDNGTWPGVV